MARGRARIATKRTGVTRSFSRCEPGKLVRDGLMFDLAGAPESSAFFAFRPSNRAQLRSGRHAKAVPANPGRAPSSNARISFSDLDSPQRPVTAPGHVGRSFGRPFTSMA